MGTISKNSSGLGNRGRDPAGQARAARGGSQGLLAGLVGITLLALAAALDPLRSSPSLILFVHANPLALHHSELAEGHLPGAAADDADSHFDESLYDLVSPRYPFEDPENSETSAAHRLAPRAYTYNQILRKSLYDAVSAPRTALQGLDIGSPNGYWAMIWSDGNPRLAQWNTLTRTVRNRWFLLRKPLTTYGCTPLQTTWPSLGHIYTKCGLSTLLHADIGTVTVKAKTVVIDNAGTVRFYGPKPAVGSAPLLLTIIPTTANYTASPAANIKVTTLVATATKVSSGCEPGFDSTHIIVVSRPRPKLKPKHPQKQRQPQRPNQQAARRRGRRQARRNPRRRNPRL